MTEARLALGAWGEEQAALYLRRQGWCIVVRNLRTPVGEIDLLVRNRRHLVFVEVKSRRSVRYGVPAEAVGARKQRQIIQAARWYLAENGLGRLQPRFDVVAVLGEPGSEFRIEHIEDAFGAEGWDGP